MSALSTLQSQLGITFVNPALLEQALVHTSYINENPGTSRRDNQRMEFLGDALLNFIIAEMIYREFPDLPEGRLTEIRVSLIRQETLAEKACAVKLGDHMLLGRGEDQSGGRTKLNNLADAFEALVAAVFLDQGVEIATSFITKHFLGDISDIKSGHMSQNFKALLQELTQADYRTLPVYQAVRTTGPDHDRIFFVSVSLSGAVLATASGKSKKAAEAEAARLAYRELSGGPQA